MSQRDLAAELRAARITAPDEVRDRVRLIAAADTTPTRRFTLRSVTWRRALVVALPIAAAVAATIVFTRPSGEHPAVERGAITVIRSAGADSAKSGAGATLQQPVQTHTPGVPNASPPAPTRGRVQQYDASLALRVPTPDGVSTGVKRALRIASALGGYPVSVHASTRAKRGTADLTLKIPRQHVQEAVARLSQIGTITREQVDIQDLEAGINQTDRTMVRLQRTLADLRAQKQTPVVQRKIAALTARITQLQRARAATIRRAHFATVSLHLATPQVLTHHKVHHGPLHGLGIAFHWIWIGAVYALALAVPLALLLLLAWLAVRTVRRRREDALLSRP